MPPLAGGKSGVSSRTRGLSVMTTEVIKPDAECQERPEDAAPVARAIEMFVKERSLQHPC